MGSVCFFNSYRNKIPVEVKEKFIDKNYKNSFTGDKEKIPLGRRDMLNDVYIYK